MRMKAGKERGKHEKLVGQAVKIVDLIDYQEGSVVSRTIIDRDIGTVTLFAFDEGEGLSEHSSPYDALAQVVDGEAEIVIAGRTIHVNEGELVIMPADQPHSLKALKRFKMVLTMIKS